MTHTFDDLEFEIRTDGIDGVTAEFQFDNGYGISVIRGEYSYGGPQGLYEMAVLHDGKLCYDTPVTNDVMGHLDPPALTAAMAEVQALPAKAGGDA